MLLYARAEPPSAPRGPVIVTRQADDSAEIRWSPPETSGGTPISAYLVEVREATRTSWRRVASVEATTTTYTLRNMMADVVYYVRIVARNAEGESMPLSSQAIEPPKTLSE